MHAREGGILQQQAVPEDQPACSRRKIHDLTCQTQILQPNHCNPGALFMFQGNQKKLPLWSQTGPVLPCVIVCSQKDTESSAGPTAKSLVSSEARRSWRSTLRDPATPFAFSPVSCPTLRSLTTSMTCSSTEACKPFSGVAEGPLRHGSRRLASTVLCCHYMLHKEMPCSHRSLGCHTDKGSGAQTAIGSSLLIGRRL